MDRLAQRWPTFAARLAALPDHEQRSAAQRAAAAALVATGQLTQRLDDRPLLEAEVERLDDVAWQVQEQVDDGQASDEAYEEAFGRARAVNAALVAHHGGAPGEALYEALHALPETTDPISFLAPERQSPR